MEDYDGDGRTDGPNDVPADGIPNTDQRRNYKQKDSEAYGSINRWGGMPGVAWWRQMARSSCAMVFW